MAVAEDSSEEAVPAEKADKEEEEQERSEVMAVATDGLGQSSLYLVLEMEVLIDLIKHKRVGESLGLYTGWSTLVCLKEIDQQPLSTADE